MIQVKNLTKKYGDRTAVDDVTFSVAKGEALGFLGPNGAGKTTTMKIITGCLASTSGSVSIDQKDTVEFPFEAKSKIGYLPEIPPVYEDMYVEKYLSYVGQLKRCRPKDIPSLIESAMEKTGLTDVRGRLIGHLSKGYRQRVGLAQALLANPDVLILDEPTVGLDPAQVIEIRKLIRRLKKDHTIILSTHILSEVEANCERVVIIHQGKLAKAGYLPDLKKAMKTRKRNLRIRVKNPSEKIQSLLQSLNGVDQVQPQEDGYVVSIEGELNDQIAGILIEQKAGFLEMIEDSVTLEDIFIHITKSKGF